MLTITSLPVDVIILIFESLGLFEFSALALTSHDMYTIVSRHLPVLTNCIVTIGGNI